MAAGEGAGAPDGEATQETSLSAIIDRVVAASHRDRVTVREIVEAIGRRSFLPLLLLPALVAATPLSGIPGLTAICGLLIATISAEMLLRFDHLRLPRPLMRRGVEGRRLREGLEKVRPVVTWLDRHTRNRLSGLFHRPMIYIPQALCLASGLLMPFLEVIPFSGSIVATGVCLLALSLLTRDGLFFVLALLPYAGLGLLAARVLG